MNKKYKLLEDDTIIVCSPLDSSVKHTLYRIEALDTFGIIATEQKGGYIESEYNLDTDDYSWVSGDAQVFGDVKVNRNGRVCNNSIVYGCKSADAIISPTVLIQGTVMDDAKIIGIGNGIVINYNSIVKGYAKLKGSITLEGNTRVEDHAQLIGDIILDNMYVNGATRLYGGSLDRMRDFITLGPVGPSREFVTYNTVEDTVSSNLFRKEYRNGESLPVGSYKDFKALVNSYDHLVFTKDNVCTEHNLKRDNPHYAERLDGFIKSYKLAYKLIFKAIKLHRDNESSLL